MSKTKDDLLLNKLTVQRARYNTRMDACIAAVRQRINNRWAGMSVRTLILAMRAEKQRLHDLGLPDAYTKERVSREIATRVGGVDPRGVPAPGKAYYYNAVTDVDWHYHDVSGHMEPADDRWAISVTSASTHNPIRRYQRQNWFAKQRRAA